MPRALTTPRPAPATGTAQQDAPLRPSDSQSTLMRDTVPVEPTSPEEPGTPRKSGLGCLASSAPVPAPLRSSGFLHFPLTSIRDLPRKPRASLRMRVVEILIGFFIAATIGLTGVGGGVLTTPFLILFLDVPTAQAVGTALAFSALVKLPACLVYLQQNAVDFRVLRFMLVGGLPGVVAGSLLVGRMEDAGLKSLVLIAVGITIAATAALNLVRLFGSPERPAPDADRSRLLPAFTLPIGLEVGFSSAGAGALGTLVLLYLTSLTAAQVVGTDLLFGLALSAVGGGLHVALGDWDRALFLRLTLGGIPGALLGAKLATVLPARVLRAALLVWLVYMGSQLFYRGILAFGR